MAPIVQGVVYRCNFEPVLGHELSGHRGALVLSSNELHEPMGVAIAAPTSGQEPPTRALGWHRAVAGSRNWASVRQVKTVPTTLLNQRAPEGEATREEFDDVRQRITSCLLTAAIDRRIRLGNLELPIHPGTVLTIRAYSPDGTEYDQQCMVCNYNGNGIANAFVVSEQPRTDSQIAVEVSYPDGQLTVLAHQIRSVDLAERVISVDHRLSEPEVFAVVERFLDLIAWQRD